jgi:hypothetical protein
VGQLATTALNAVAFSAVCLCLGIVAREACAQRYRDSNPEPGSAIDNSHL